MNARPDSTRFDPVRSDVPPERRRLRGTPRDVFAFVGLVAAIATGLALALPGTEEEPGPVTLLTLLVPAIASGIVHATRRHRADRLPPSGFRRAG